MLNGRFDFFFPVDTSQRPMFETLGTPKAQKRHMLYDTGHGIPRVEMIKETLDWLDRYQSRERRLRAPLAREPGDSKTHGRHQPPRADDQGQARLSTAPPSAARRAT